MKITANSVTITRIVLMPLPGYLLYQGRTALVFAFFTIIILAATDWLDGVMARKDGPTVLGGLLDPIADKIFLAVCFLPFAQMVVPEWNQVVFPAWMLALMFSRDFLVTSLRTSLSLKGAPMRTSLLAKYKTAIQMTAVPYLLTILIAHRTPVDLSFYLAILMTGAALIPVAYILYRMATGMTPGKRSITMALMSSGFAAVYIFTNARFSIWVLTGTVTFVTVLSGISYLVDAWSAMKTASNGLRDISQFVLEGILIPTSFIAALAYYTSPLASTLLILGITLELASGGLANLLASKAIHLPFRWQALKSTLEVTLLLVAIALYRAYPDGSPPLGETLIIAATAIALANTIIAYVKHRSVYLSQL